MNIRIKVVASAAGGIFDVFKNKKLTLLEASAVLAFVVAQLSRSTKVSVDDIQSTITDMAKTTK